MRKLLKSLGIVLAVAVAAIQFVRPERTNPPTDAARTIRALLPMTQEAAAVFDRSCRDCHSHETRWPWYSYVAPTSWFVTGHVNHARSHLNVSDWAQYDSEEAEHRVQGMCRLARKGKMPLDSYLIVHRGARLSAQDVTALCDWALVAKEKIPRDAGATAGQPESFEEH